MDRDSPVLFLGAVPLSEPSRLVSSELTSENSQASPDRRRDMGVGLRDAASTRRDPDDVDSVTNTSAERSLRA
jgi:hypothetical protein